MIMDINIIPKFLDAALTPVAKEIGERLSDIVSLAFTPVIKLRAVRDMNLSLFLEDLNNKIEKIPEENLKEPPINIVGPALEDIGKYYHNEKYLRTLFSNLISSSMNKKSYVHPSYINIIEQLSSDDARFISEMLIRASDLGANSDDYISKNIKLTYYSYNGKWQDAVIYWIEDNNTLRKIENNEELIQIKTILTNLYRLGIIYFRDYTIPIFDREKYKLGNEPISLEEETIVLTKYGLYFANSCCILE